MSSFKPKITTISVFPDIIASKLSTGVVGKALTDNIFSLENIDIRDHSDSFYIDSRTVGGLPGMLLKPEPLSAAINHAKTLHTNKPMVISTSASGQILDQELVAKLSKKTDLMFIAGRYQGIDYRVTQQHVDLEISLGDYILSNGELAICILIDAIARLYPDVLSNIRSIENDSHQHSLLEEPLYTKPREFNGLKIPEILASGDHKAVAKWRIQQKLLRTYNCRPDMLEFQDLEYEHRCLLLSGLRKQALGGKN